MTPITTFANMPSPDPSFLGAMSGQGMGGIPFPPPQHRPDLPPGFPVNPFLQLPGSPGHQAQMAQHAQVRTSDNDVKMYKDVTFAGRVTVTEWSAARSQPRARGHAGEVWTHAQTVAGVSAV